MAFRLRGKDVTVVTDPDPDAGAGKVQADIVTVSRNDPDQPTVNGANGGPRVVNGPGEYELKDVLIAGVATASEPQIGATNTAYVFRFDDLAVCHLGGLQAKLTDKQVEEIGDIDVLMIPIGGNGTVGPGGAAEVVAQLDPALVIPMEYQAREDASVQPVDYFCREMGTKDFVPQPKLSVSKNSLPTEVRVVVLENRRAQG